MENILFAILSLIVGIVIGWGLFYLFLADRTSKSMKNANKLNCSIFFINECGIFSISKPISLINILVVTPIFIKFITSLIYHKIYD